jgi:hypothetical protein
MRWQRANLEEKQEPRAATSASAKRHAEGMWHDVTRKTLTEAAIEKRSFEPISSVHIDLVLGYVGFEISKRKKLAGSDFLSPAGVFHRITLEKGTPDPVFAPYRLLRGQNSWIPDF